MWVDGMEVVKEISHSPSAGGNIQTNRIILIKIKCPLMMYVLIMLNYILHLNLQVHL